jgi:hypothetical protein
MKFLWKTYYKFRLGQRYTETVDNATSLNRSISDMTAGRMNTFYDMQGNRIKGWVNGSVRIKKESNNPLIEKYGR